MSVREPYPGEIDDAIHARRRWWHRRTLCGLPAKPRNVEPLKTFGPDGWSGCWTCLSEAKEARNA